MVLEERSLTGAKLWIGCFSKSGSEPDALPEDDELDGCKNVEETENG